MSKYEIVPHERWPDDIVIMPSVYGGHNEYDEHVVTWWAHERGHTGETALQRRIALDFRDTFMAFTDSYLDSAELGERVGGPLGILGALELTAEAPIRNKIPSPHVDIGHARRQREDRNERAVAWLRHATGQNDAPWPT